MPESPPISPETTPERREIVNPRRLAQQALTEAKAALLPQAPVNLTQELPGAQGDTPAVLPPPPGAGTVLPSPEADRPSEAPLPGVDSAKADENAERARVRDIGLRRYSTELPSLLTEITSRVGRELTEETFPLELETLRHKARVRESLSPAERVALTIDAQARFGKDYSGKWNDLVRDYNKLEKEWEDVQAEEIDPTPPPSHLGTGVDQHGKVLVEMPLFVGDQLAQASARARSQVLQKMPGTAAGAVFGSNIPADIEAKQKYVEQKFSADDARKMGMHSYAELLKSPFDHGSAKRKNLRVYLNQMTNGTVGYNYNAYFEMLTLYHLDEMMNRQRLTARTATPEEVQELRKKAEEVARSEVMSLTNRLTSEGHVMITTDPEGVQKRILRGEAGLFGLSGITPSTLLRAAGLDAAADVTAQAMAPFVAMSVPSSLVSDQGQLTFGKKATVVQSEHPLHWMARAGFWSTLLSWKYGEDDWGSAGQLGRIQGGYDFTQDMTKYGADLAGLVGLEGNEWAEWIAAGGATIAMAFIDADPLTLATMGVGKPLRALGAASKVGLRQAQVRRVQQALRVGMEQGDLAQLERALDAIGTPHAEALRVSMLQKLGDAGAKIPTEARNAARSIADDLKMSAQEVAAKREQTAKLTAERSARAREKADEARAKVTEAEKNWHKIDAEVNADVAKIRAQAGEEVAQTTKKALDTTRDIAGTEVRISNAEAQFKAMLHLVPKAFRKQLEKDGLKKVSDLIKQSLDAEKAVKAKKKPGMTARQKDLKNTKKVFEQVAVKGIIDEWLSAQEALKALRKQKVGLEQKLKALKAKAAKQAVDGVKIPAKVTAPRVKATKTWKASRKAAGKAYQAMRVQVDKAYRAKALAERPVLTGEEILRKTVKESAKDLLHAYEKFEQISGSFGKQWSDLLTGPKELPAIGAVAESVRGGKITVYDLRMRLHEKYPNLSDKDWPEILRHADPKQVLDMGETTEGLRLWERLREFERMQMRKEAEILKGDAVIAERAVKDVFDPNQPLRRNWSKLDPQRVLIGLHRAAANLRRWSPSAQIMGDVSKELEEVAMTAIRRQEYVETEIGGLLSTRGNTLNEVVTYLSTHEALPTVVGTTVYNRTNKLTMVEKWLHQLLNTTLDDAAELPLEFSAVARMWLPPGQWGDLPAKIAEANLRAALEKWSKMSPQEVMADLISPEGTLAKATMAKGKIDVPQRALKFAVEGIVHGALKHDLHEDMMRAFGFFTPKQVRAMNLLMHGGAGAPTVSRGGKGFEKGTGHINRADMIEAYHLWNRLGISTGYPQISRIALKQAESNKELARWMSVNTENIGAVPGHLLAYIDGKAGKIVKELEPHHGANSMPYWLKSSSLNWLNAWRRSVVLGIVLPRFGHFANTWAGDATQLIWSRGLVEGSILTARGTFTYLPLVGRQIQDKLSDVALEAGGKNKALNLLMNPYLSAVIRADESVVVMTKEGPMNCKILHEQMFEDGVHQFILSKELDHATRRMVAHDTEKMLSKLGRGVNDWSRNWTDMMENIQFRARAAAYLEDRVGKKLSRRETRERLFESLYDWRHGATPFELNTLANLSGFYMFWRGAYNQLGKSLLEPVTLPFHQAFTRGLTGQSKLGRAVSTGQVAMAIPEYVWYDDPEEELTALEGYHEWAKRKAPWHFAARPWFTSRKKTREQAERDYMATGKWHDWEVASLPLMTTMDSLYLFSLMAQGIIAAASPEVELSADYWEQLGTDLAEKMNFVVQPGLEAIMGLQYEGIKGVPLREGEAEALTLLGGGGDGLLNALTSTDEDGRRYMHPSVGAIFGTILRAIPVVATEIPPWMAATASARRQETAQAGAMRFIQQITNIMKVYSHDPAASHDANVKKVEARLKELERKAGIRGKGVYR